MIPTMKDVSPPGLAALSCVNTSLPVPQLPCPADIKQQHTQWHRDQQDYHHFLLQSQQTKRKKHASFKQLNKGEQVKINVNARARQKSKSPHIVREQGVCQSTPGEKKNSNYSGTHRNKAVFPPHPPTAANNVLLKIFSLFRASNYLSLLIKNCPHKLKKGRQNKFQCETPEHVPILTEFCGLLMCLNVYSNILIN